MKRESKGITVSSDLGGVIPDLYKIKSIYKDAGFDNVGIEVVWLKNQNQYVQDLSHGFNVFDKVDGFHGQLGSDSDPRNHQKGFIDWGIIKIVDSLIPSELDALPPLLRVDMIGQLLERDIYLNVHNDVLLNQYDDYMNNVSSFCYYSHLTVENGPNSGSVEMTKRLVENLRQDTGKEVTGTFDVVHAVIGLLDGGMPDLSNTKKVWRKALKLIDLDIFHHLHFPIGTRADDSLPIVEMIKHDPKMLQDLSDLTGEMRITIENQHGLINGLTFWEERKEVDRLKMINEEMKKVGMI